MIPFRDNIPSRTFPLINISIIIANCAIFFYELSFSTRGLTRLVGYYGVVPARVFAWPESTLPLTALVIPFFASMFLHGGWLHLIGNLWFLRIFGRNVEDRMGHLRYLLLYLGAGAAAALMQLAADPRSALPTVGASGAIAGVMGAYFILLPYARIVTLVPIFFFFQVIEIPMAINKALSPRQAEAVDD